jgi:hypothetical protein
MQRLAQEIGARADWADILRARKTDATLPTLSGRDLPGMFEAMRVDFLRGKSASALAISRAAAFLDASQFISHARRSGLFRSSKVAFRCEPIAHVVKTLLEDGEVFGWCSEEVGYLESVANLLSLAPNARATRLCLVAEIYKRRKTMLKSCMVIMDRAFRPAADHQPDEEQQIAEATGSSHYFSREQKASAFSTVVVLMQETCGIDENATAHIDEAGIRNGTFERLMMDAERLNEFKEAEVQLDGYPYRADKVEGRAKSVVVSAIDDRLEQSIRLGFANASMQAQIAGSHADNETANMVSLYEMAMDLYRAAGHLVVTRVRTPQDRYAMALPMHPDIVGFLSDSRAFREEAYYLRHIAREAFARGLWIGDYPLVDGITVMDMLKIQRFFAFLATVFFEALDQPVIDGDRDELDMRSRIPVIQEQLLLEYLATVYGEELAQRALKTLSYDPKAGNGHYDVQYKPILRVGSWYMVPLSVLFMSDLVRNVLYQHSVRLLPADGHDPMLRALEVALTQLGFLAKAKVKGKISPIDLVAYFQGHLFILEGKNSFHPCSTHEMRTSYGHIQKASRQLAREAEWLAVPETQAQVFKNLDWHVRPTLHIHTCIVTANRIFSGYAIDGHPVRQAHELLNVLQSGVINMDAGRYRFWKGESFSVEHQHRSGQL